VSSRVCRFAPLAALLLALAGCAAQGAGVGASEEWRLRSLEENFLGFKETQRAQVDQGKDLEARVEQRLKSVEGRLSAIEERLAQAAKAAPPPPPPASIPTPAPTPVPTPAARPVPAAPAEIKAPMPAPAAPVAPPAEKPVAKSGEERPWEEVPGAKAPAAPAPVVQTAPAKPALSAAEAAAQYGKALEILKAGQIEPARKAFADFLAQNPSSPLVPNALYWLGETFYADKNFPQAILTFKEVTRRFPEHHKAAAALLKIGMAYERAGDAENAAFYWKALLDGYPKSEPAGIARQKLKGQPG
jgi:tol-pal system protein YbgF